VPRRLLLERDAPVAAPPQSLLLEGRTQDISAHPLQARPIVRPHRTLACRSNPSKCACRGRATSRLACRARRHAAAPAPLRARSGATRPCTGSGPPSSPRASVCYDGCPGCGA
jgi:hypothetical protein